MGLVAGTVNSGGDAAGDVLTGIENLMGSAAGDRLYGNPFANKLDGRFGADLIAAGAGDDTLIGGSGLDTLTGAAGLDQFMLGTSATGADHVTDFNVADDTLQVSAAAFGGGLAAGMNVGATGHFFANAGGVASGTLSQFLYDTSTGGLYWDADGTNAGVRQLIATLDNKALITTADILVIA